MNCITMYSLPLLKRVAVVLNRDNQRANLIYDLSPIRHIPMVLITYQKNRLRLVQFNASFIVCSTKHNQLSPRIIRRDKLVIIYKNHWF